MSSDGGAGGAGGFFDRGDAEFEAAQGKVGEIEGVARDALTAGREAKTGYWGRRTAAAEAVAAKYSLDQQTSRGIAKDVQLETDAIALDVMGMQIRDQDIITSAFSPAPFVTNIGEMLAEEAWDAGWSVGDPDIGQGFDTGGLPDLAGVDAASPGPDFDVAATAPVLPVVEDTTFTPRRADAVPTGGKKEAAAGATATPLTAVGAATSRARRRGRTATIATSTLGVPAKAPVVRKTLLGA